MKFGFLYRGYKDHTFYWECLTMYRKVAMIFISVFLDGIGSMVQALVVLVLLLIFVVLTIRRKPYKSRKLNDLEVFSLVTSAITIYCGVFFLSSRPRSDASFQESRDFFLSPDMKWVLFTVIVAINLTFFLLWTYSFLNDIRQHFRLKCPNLYVCLCLCCRRSLLEEEVENAKIDRA